MQEASSWRWWSARDRDDNEDIGDDDAAAVVVRLVIVVVPAAAILVGFIKILFSPIYLQIKEYSLQPVGGMVGVVVTVVVAIAMTCNIKQQLILAGIWNCFEAIILPL